VARVSCSRPPELTQTHSDGIEEKYHFVRYLEETEGVTIIGPSEHN
jgi:hypothetical protein